MTVDSMGIELGDIVRDKISGFEGAVMGVYVYLNGCVRIGVAPTRTGDKGELLEEKGFDVQQLEVVKPGAHRIEQKKTGGPDRFVPHRQDPPRR